tara:strand:+ start:807 stop:1844 length:1038 start_codon:yes stop_codon:yes gene_type:complete
MKDLAIVNVQYFLNSKNIASCGLSKWCFSAKSFTNLPFLDSDALVITNKPKYVKAVCKGLYTIPINKNLEKSVMLWIENRSRDKISRTHLQSIEFSGANLMKWQTLSLIMYRAVLLIDIDVDLFLNSRGVLPSLGTPERDVLDDTWNNKFRYFLNSSDDLVVTADIHSPINGGIILLKPCLYLFKKGIQVIENRQWSESYGFNHVGKPRNLLKNVIEAHKSRMWRHNTWNFVTADGDQGLFVYIYLIEMGGNVRWKKSSNLKVNHFFYGHKPWRPATRCALYFDNFDKWATPLDTKCWLLLKTKNICLNANKTDIDTCKWCKKKHHKSACERPSHCGKETSMRIL